MFWKLRLCIATMKFRALIIAVGTNLLAPSCILLNNGFQNRRDLTVLAWVFVVR